MISDILFDALQNIEDYEKTYPEMYEGSQLVEVKAAMRKLQRELEMAAAFSVPGREAQ